MLWGFGAVEGVVATLDAGVVQIALFVGAAAEIPFEIDVRGKEIEIPCFELLEQSAHILGNLPNFLFVAQPLAIRRVGNVDAVRRIGDELCRGAVVELDEVGNACPFGVKAGYLHGFVVNVAADNLERAAAVVSLSGAV